MKPYHKRFQNIDRRAVVAFREARRGWATKTESEREQALVELVGVLSTIYRIALPAVQFGELEDCYQIGSRTIQLMSANSVSMLHEFRHHWQNCNDRLLQLSVEDTEDDARAWSLSLMHIATPRTLRRLAETNRIIHLTPAMTNREQR